MPEYRSSGWKPRWNRSHYQAAWISLSLLMLPAYLTLAQTDRSLDSYTKNYVNTCLQDSNDNISNFYWNNKQRNVQAPRCATLYERIGTASNLVGLSQIRLAFVRSSDQPAPASYYEALAAAVQYAYSGTNIVATLVVARLSNETSSPPAASVAGNSILLLTSFPIWHFKAKEMSWLHRSIIPVALETQYELFRLSCASWCLGEQNRLWKNSNPNCTAANSLGSIDL